VSDPIPEIMVKAAHDWSSVLDGISSDIKEIEGFLRETGATIDFAMAFTDEAEKTAIGIKWGFIGSGHRLSTQVIAKPEDMNGEWKTMLETRVPERIRAYKHLDEFLKEYAKALYAKMGEITNPAPQKHWY